MIASLLLCGLISAVIGASPDRNVTYYILTSEMKVLQPSKTTAVLTSIVWPDFSQNTSVIASIPSNIRCSFEANKAGATAFTFRDGTCSLLSPGSAIISDVAFYQPIVFPTDDSLEEVARNKTATGTTPYSSSWGPGKAVDGVPSDESMYHSSLAVRPWWQVDLLEERRIYQIQIYPRQHSSYYMRFHNVEVRIGTTYVGSGNLSSYSLLCSYTKTYTLLEGYLLCSRYEGVVGRYISVQITAAASEYLQIVEVNIFAYNTSALIH